MTRPAPSPHQKERDHVAQNPLDMLMEKVTRQRMLGQSVDAFISTFHQCMVQKKVNLDAAIVMTRRIVDEDEKLDPSPPEALALLNEGFTIAEEKMRNALSEAYRLIKLNEEGAAEPLPYDADEHAAARVEAFDSLRAEGLL